jgi:hypothetical protein
MTRVYRLFDGKAGNLRRMTAGECRLFLQLPLERLDFLGERRVVAHEMFDFTHRVQDGGMVAAAKASADFGQ